MIKLDKIKIKVNPNSRMYYNSLGYNCVNYDIIEIHTLDLPPGSNIYIEILCDNCGAESTTKYNKYYKSTNGSSNNNYCKKCSHGNYYQNDNNAPYPFYPSFIFCSKYIHM